MLLELSALAAPVTVRSAAGPVVVTVDGTPRGTTPLDLDLDGSHVLGFRSTAFGADLFTQRVEPTAPLTVEVDLAKRMARVTATPPPESAPVAPPTAAPPPTTESQGPPPAGPTGDLFVQSDLPGAAILVDDRDTGLVTPAMVRGVAAGPHEVVVRTDCARAEGAVTVGAGVITRLADLVLKQGDGALRIEVEPVDATLYVDGVEAGPAPFEGAVSCGLHAIEARAPGHISQSTSAFTPAFRLSTWTLRLVPETYGVLVVDVAPLTAIVAVDGVELDPGPVTVDPISSGLHTLEVRADGHEPHTESVTVAADQVARFTIELAPMGTARVPGGPSGLRLGANVGLSAAALGAGGVALAEYLTARSAYGDFLDEPDDGKAENIWDERVAPHSTMAAVAGVVGGVLAIGSGALWVTTDFNGAAAGRLGIGGRW